MQKYKEIQFIETTKEETGNGLLLYVLYDNDNIILYNYGCEDLPEEKQNNDFFLSE